MLIPVNQPSLNVTEKLDLVCVYIVKGCWASSGGEAERANPSIAEELQNKVLQLEYTSTFSVTSLSRFVVVYIVKDISVARFKVSGGFYFKACCTEKL